jgi:tRNA dimethylallyltransferase
MGGIEMTAPKICPAIVGPTAVGKTGLITRLAADHAIEVISLDSRQIYQGLRIGTAQPTAEELAICPHHLIDFVSPSEKFDAVRFRQEFEKVFLKITGRGGQPVLVGGAGMYLTALREGFMEIPGHSPERLAVVRGELEPLTDETIRKRLEKADPESLARIHPNDRYRSQRALEICTISGETMTSLTARQQPDPVLGLEFPAYILARPVPELDERIAQRTKQMLKEGWIEETEAALKDHTPRCPGLLSIGYREIVSWLEGEFARENLDETIVLVTRQYAKRQRTLFRHLAALGTWHPESGEIFQAIGSKLN